MATKTFGRASGEAKQKLLMAKFCFPHKFYVDFRTRNGICGTVLTEGRLHAS